MINYREYYLPGGFPHEGEKVSRNRTGFWTTREGDMLHITTVSDSHLIAIVNMVCRQAKEMVDNIVPYRADTLPGRTFTLQEILDLDAGLWHDQEWLFIKCFAGLSIAPYLVMEVIRRGFVKQIQHPEVIQPHILTDAWEEYRVRHLNGYNS